MSAIINFLLDIGLERDQIRESESLSNHTYTRTGGQAEIFVQPRKTEDVLHIIQFAKSENIPITVLGNGANVLVSDNGLKGIVLSMGKLKASRVRGNKIEVESGATLIDVSQLALNHRLTGLEFACGIPGTIGGAIVMNAGAYGGEISSVVDRVMVMTSTGELLTLTQQDLQFGYRCSVFSRNNYIILKATFQLQQFEYRQIKERMERFTMLREAKQPLEYPSCGSVFKRPANHYTGKLIQDCGLQGFKIGGAEVSTKHAGFIINTGQATTKDYLQVIRHIQQTVSEKYDIDLDTEVQFLG